MPPIQLAGLADIQTAAQALGINVTDTVNKAQMMLQTNPGAVRAGGEQLNTVASGLGTSQQDIGRAGTDMLAGGMTGKTADNFGVYHVGMVNDMAGSTEIATQLGQRLGQIATVFQQGQQTVVTATGATAAALRMMQV